MSVEMSDLARQTSAATLLVLCLGLTAPAQSAATSSSNTSSSGLPGRVELDFESSVPPKVEVDLSQGILTDLSGIARSAVSGALNAIVQSSGEHGGESVPLTVEQLNAVQEIAEAVTDVVHEVRIRVYEMPESAQEVPGEMFAYYQAKLRAANWDNVVRVRDGDENVNISLLRNDGGLLGVFIVVAEDDEAVIVNAACELSPEKVERVTNQATKIGLQFGLGDVLEEVIQDVRQEIR